MREDSGEDSGDTVPDPAELEGRVAVILSPVLWANPSLSPESVHLFMERAD